MRWALFLVAWIVSVVDHTSASKTEQNTLLRGAAPQVTSKSIRQLIALPALQSHLQALQDVAFSTPQRNRALCQQCSGLNKSIEYIQNQFEPFSEYYNRIDDPWIWWPGKNRSTKFQYHNSIEGRVEVSHLDIDTAAWSRASNTSGILVPVRNNGCSVSDYPAEIKGQIAFVKAGECSQHHKAMAAELTGAKALVTYILGTSNYKEARSGGQRTPIRTNSPIQTIGLSGKPALALSKYVGAEPTNITMNILNPGVPQDGPPQNWVFTKNLCYESKTGDPSRTIMLGAHIDSVEAGPGINDNGSSISALLEIAKQLARFSIVNKVKFCFWSGEERGLLGSTFFVTQLSEEEKARIALYLNFDMIAGLNPSFGVLNGSEAGPNGIPPAGSGAISHIWGDYFGEIQTPIVYYPFEGHTDHTPFKEAGIPIGAMTTGGMGMKDEADVRNYGGKVGDRRDPFYHTANDTIENVDTKALFIETKAIAHAVAVLAVDVSSVEKLRRDHKIVSRRS